MSNPLASIAINAAQLDQILESRKLPGLTVKDLVVQDENTDAGKPPIQNVEFPDGGGSPPPTSGEVPDNEVPPAGYYDAPQSSYAAANYDVIGGAGMNGYFLTTPHPFWMPAGPHNRPATKAAAEKRYTEIGAELEAFQASAGFTGRYPEDQGECVAREEVTRQYVGDPDHKTCTEWFLLRHVFGLGGG